MGSAKTSAEVELCGEATKDMQKVFVDQVEQAMQGLPCPSQLPQIPAAKEKEEEQPKGPADEQVLAALKNASTTHGQWDCSKRSFLGTAAQKQQHQ